MPRALVDVVATAGGSQHQLPRPADYVHLCYGLTMFDTMFRLRLWTLVAQVGLQHLRAWVADLVNLSCHIRETFREHAVAIVE